MLFDSGGQSTGGGTPFEYTCPGEAIKTQVPGTGMGFTAQRCPVAGVDVTITADYAVTPTASG